MHDDVLVGDATAVASHAIGPSRTKVTYLPDAARRLLLLAVAGGSAGSSNCCWLSTDCTNILCLQVQLPHARHDVFVSADRHVVTATLQYLETWLVSQGFEAKH